MYEHVKTGCKHIPPSEQPLQFQSGYFLNKPRKHTHTHTHTEVHTHTHTRKFDGRKIKKCYS